MRIAHIVKQFIREVKRKEVRTVPVPQLTDTTKLLEGRVALVTGGSGGIGRAIAKAFVNAGAKVVLAARDSRSLADAASDLGPNVTYIVLDLGVPEEFGHLLATLKEFPDILVNGGGVLSMSPFGDIAVDEYDRVMDTNVRGMLFLSQEISNTWKKAGTRGNILNISSGSQFKPGWTPYQVSKNAVDSLTRGMAYFLVDHDIVVNAIAPGPVATPMLSIESDDITFAGNPSGRALTPDEVAVWSTFLVSDLGRYAVGSTFALTGGNGVFQWERQGKFLS